MKSSSILITGAFGQIGGELIEALQQRFGPANVIALDLRTKPAGLNVVAYQSDATDSQTVEKIIERHQIKTVYHLASLLSATGEQQPDLAWQVNANGLKTILDLAVKHQLQLFWPSSIAVFGPTTPKKMVPQRSVLEPTTMYGVTKLAGEQLCHYYHLKYGLDVRSLRYPGLISWKTPPGGGTTDYAVDIFHQALQTGRYSCFLKAETTLPMMYMDDAIRATIELMSAAPERLSVRTSYNLAGVSFAPKELASAISQTTPVTVVYKPDFRQQIADSWPESIDDTVAFHDWAWQPEFDLVAIVKIMLDNLKVSLAPPTDVK